MPLIWKIAAAAVTAAVLGLLIRRSNPELTALLSLLSVCCVLISAFSVLEGMNTLLSQVRRLIGESGEYTGPMLKCVAISIVTKISADLCRDSAQTAPASALELAGTVCAVAAALPLILNVLKLLGDLV